MRSKTIIASTYGIDQSEIENYRYQSTRTKQPIYSIGEYYFSCGKRKPTDDVGHEWCIDIDQFWAEQNKTILWSSRFITSEENT
jgi:hypothetical protein